VQAETAQIQGLSTELETIYTSLGSEMTKLMQAGDSKAKSDRKAETLRMMMQLMG